MPSQTAAAPALNRWHLREIHMQCLIAIVLAFVFAQTVLASPLEDAQAAVARRDYEKAVALLTPLADKGDPDALGNLGNMYASGQGVEKDISRAAVLWRKAADKGLGSAMGSLGFLYQTGQGGFTQDSAVAISWFTKAAEHGHAPSMMYLSSAYAQGNGVAKDPIRSVAWADLAASNTTNPKLKHAAQRQIFFVGSTITKEEIRAAEKLSNKLRKTIDANVAKHKAQ